MSGRTIIVYYAWNRQGEGSAPLEVIENRFPSLFESRRMGYPKFEELSDPLHFDQGIYGFLDHIMKRNFTAFVDLARTRTGNIVTEVERGDSDGKVIPLNAALPDDADTLIVISFDSFRTGQAAAPEEIETLRRFLDKPGHVAFICPHHDIGDVPDLPHDERLSRQVADFHHHGDRTIPPQQRFGLFARSLLAGLGVPVENRFGLRPAAEADGAPSPIEAVAAVDRLGLLNGVTTFNLHPHLPHLERMGDALARLEVLARQKIDPAAPPHPFTAEGRTLFDALLQSRPDVFSGTLLVGDATLWSSTAGGVDSLQRFWCNVLDRPAHG